MVYEDGQDGYDYTKGRYSLRSFKLQGKANSLSIQQHKDGTFITEYDSFVFNLHALPFEITGIVIDNEEVSLETVKLNGRSSIKVNKNFTVLNIKGK